MNQFHNIFHKNKANNKVSNKANKVSNKANKKAKINQEKFLVIILNNIRKVLILNIAIQVF